LIVSDLHKIYEDGTHAVKGISFNVREGEVYGLIGPNGAGKTTTLRMIAGLIKPTRGEIHVDGIDVVRETFKARKLIGYLPEEADVYTRLTGLEHIEFYAKLYGVKDLEETIRYGVELSGLPMEKLRERAGGYSKGMKRRLLLAIVLMRRPRLALLDEPTSGLDVYASVRVREMIKKYVRETGSSIVLSSHNMLEVEYLCDRIGIIYSGRIIVEDTPSNIMERYGVSNLEEAFIKIVEEESR
jgi:ABC-2 type transport system ATP-binding protein